MGREDKNTRQTRKKKDKTVDKGTGDDENNMESLELETRRRQNRDAAARHRQRQQLRLAELGKREAVLSQQVAELEQELDCLRKSHRGLTVPDKDPFTASLLEIIEEVNELRASLMLYTVQSENLILELRQLAERLISCNTPRDTEGFQDTRDTAPISNNTEDLGRNQKESDDRR